MYSVWWSLALDLLSVLYIMFYVSVRHKYGRTTKSMRQLSFETHLLALYESTLLSNSSHGSPNYYLLIRRVSLLLYNINTVRRLSPVRTFASNVQLVPTCPTAHIALHTGGMFRTENPSGLVHTRNLSFLDQFTTIRCPRHSCFNTGHLIRFFLVQQSQTLTHA